MVLVASGDVDHKKICQWAEELFADLPRKPEDYQSPHRPARYRGGYATKSSEEEENILCMVGFEGSGYDNPTQSLLDIVLSSILSDKLMANLRNDKGLVYGAGAFASLTKDNGLFTIHAATSADRIAQATAQMCEEFKTLSQTITKEELTAVKNQMIGSLERASESVVNLGNALSSSLWKGRPFESNEDSIKRLEAVTLDQLKARAQTLLQSAPTVSAHGKGVQAVPSYEQITTLLGNTRELDESGLVKENTPSADRSLQGATIAAAPPVAQEQKRG